MFRKREKKVFPPGTFIATPVRIAAIFHLCLALSLLLWILSQPFMGDLFAVKSELILYDALLTQPHQIEQLSIEDAKWVTEHYDHLKEKLQLPFTAKLGSMLYLLFIKTPPLELAWLFFSIMIPLLLLMRYDGSAQVCWLLPIIVFAYSIDNLANAPPSIQASDVHLFPTEQTIIEKYLKAPLSLEIGEQQKELTQGWHRYLIQEWAHEQPGQDPSKAVIQVEKGEFAFILARIKARSHDKILAIEKSDPKHSLFLLALYFVWNGFFAWLAMRFLISRHLLTNCAAIGAPSLPNPPYFK